MYRPVDRIEVFAWGMRAGTVSLEPDLGCHVFEYDARWQERGLELAPLTMPVQQQRHAFPFLSPTTFNRLPALLADALPDHFGALLMDACLTLEGWPRKAITPLDRLASLGSFAMGALEFRPARGSGHSRARPINIARLVTSSGQALAGTCKSSRRAKGNLKYLAPVGIPAGGARAKAVVGWNRKTGKIRSGHLATPPGFEYWLLKLEGTEGSHGLPGSYTGSYSPYGRIEYAYSLMVKAAGIHMAECRLLKENGRAHFMTRRFDRGNGGQGQRSQRYHLQTLCAMQHLDYRLWATHSYRQYFETILELTLPESALVEGYRRMVFNVMAANCDDHTKNHAFLMEPSGRWHLAPAYDITHACTPGDRKGCPHLMSVNDKFCDITIGDLEREGERFMVPDYGRVIEEVALALGRWPEFAQAAGLLENQMAEIREDFLPCP